MMPPERIVLITAVVVTHNSAAYVLPCLRSLITAADQLAPGREAIQIVVVDNASTDGSAELAESLGAVDVVRLAENIGFGRACNLAADRADGRWVLLVNPDAQLRPGALRALLAAAHRNPHAGIYGGVAVDGQGAPDVATCWRMPSRWSMLCFAAGLSMLAPRSRLFAPETLHPDPAAGSADVTVDIVAGCFLMLTSRLWMTLGGFDPRFFLYAEDADLCLRAQQLGYRPSVTPHAQILHARGASSDSRQRQEMLFSGKATFLRVHWSPQSAQLGLAALQVGVALRAGLARATGAHRAGGVDPAAWLHLWQRRSTWRSGWPAPAVAEAV